MTETQHVQPDANDVLMGGGGYPAAKFDQMRVWVGGTLISKPRSRQETEFGTGKPKTFPKSGDPIYGLLVDVQTDQRDTTEDDGIRRMYIEGRLLKEAVRNAVTAAGASGLEPRGQLFVAWVGDGVPPSAGASAPHLWEARYYPPTTPVPAASNGAAPVAAPMPEPGQTAPATQGGLNVFGQPETPAPSFAQGEAVQHTYGTPGPGMQVPATQPAPMAEPGAQSVAPATEDYVRNTAAAVGTSEPTAEAIAALKAAGLDPQAVFPGYRG